MSTFFWFLIGFAGIIWATYMQLSITKFSVSWLIFLCLFTLLGQANLFSLLLVWGISAAILGVLLLPRLRRQALTYWLLPYFLRSLPRISETERAALDAGDVWWEGELFSGNPDWKKWLDMPPPRLSEEEQAFLDGPTEAFCKMIDDWDITQVHYDLRPDQWQFLKDNGFFGLIISKEYGGKAFSALAHSEILAKVCARSITAATIIGVPNSLGPAELLIHYGTEEQKNYYLPRLARGEEIPCFALTGPDAGSDAASIPDKGVICKHVFDGKEQLAIRLTFNKRYITLAPVATVIGLAFKLYDPDHLLGTDEDLGITCALIPRDTPGVEIGLRHFPLDNPFQNGPIRGQEVYIALDQIIGGPDYIGKGWRMLMECLSVGRGITLPSNCAGGARISACAVSAYARIRRQFNLPIGLFEGVEKVLARMTARAYIAESLRTITAGAIDSGTAPTVASAISKYHVTEIGRMNGNDGMDVVGGKGICLGPKNFIGRGFQGAPIAITVEGANILTRNLIIFGQGALRCHPYLLKEVDALQNAHPKQRLIQFDQVLFAHVGYSFSNFIRTLWLGLTNSLFVSVPASYPVRRYYQQLTRYSAALAFVADISLAVLGGNIKRKEKLSARLGDVLSCLYMGSTVLKRYQMQGEQLIDLPVVDWAMQDILYQAQEALDQFLYNFPITPLAWVLRFIVFPWGRRQRPPADYIENEIAKYMLQPSPMRDRLYGNAYIAQDPNNMIGKLEKALHQIDAAEPIMRKLRTATELEHCPPYPFNELVDHALSLKIITPTEAAFIKEYEALRTEIISVDAFTNEELGAR